jgi:hypothetical protein
MSDATDNKTRDRSPSYPVIPLQSACERLVSFEVHFKRSPAPLTKIATAWGLKEGNSDADRYVAAMRAFGLIDYQNGPGGRQALISEDGRTLLRAQQESVKRAVLKRAALRPKMIRHFWSLWSDDRPADDACLDQLILSNSFSDRGARAFLKVYDATVTYAGLSESDKVSITGDEGAEEPETASLTAPEAPRRDMSASSVSPPLAKGRVTLMDGERVVFTEEAAPHQYLKLVASGDVTDILLEALEDYVRRQRKVRAALKFTSGQAKKPDWVDKEFQPHETVPAASPFRAIHFGDHGERLFEPEGEGDHFPECDICGTKVRYKLA